MTDDVAPPGSSGPLARALSVTRRLAAHGDRIESDRRVPADVMDLLHQARLFRMTLPRALEGDAADLATLTEVIETISAVDASTGWCIGQGSGCAMTAAQLPPDVARRVFGAPDAVLAWGAGVQGKAIRTDGGWRATGRWSFASGSRAALWLGAHCKMFAADGTTPVRNADGTHAERTLLVPRGEATIDDDWHTMGLRGTGSDSYAITNHVISDALTIDRDDLSGRYDSATLFRFPQIVVYAGAFGGVMLGIARGMLDDLSTLAMTKSPRGAASSLIESPVFHNELARLEARLRTARSYHSSTLRSVWDAVDGGAPLTLEHRMDVRLASTFAINEGAAVVTEAYRAAGQTAIFPSNAFERRLRDALSVSQQVQGRRSHYTTVGRHLLGLAPDTTMFI